MSRAISICYTNIRDGFFYCKTLRIKAASTGGCFRIQYCMGAKSFGISKNSSTFASGIENVSLIFNVYGYEKESFNHYGCRPSCCFTKL